MNIPTYGKLHTLYHISMKKVNNNLGTKHCPNCQKVIMKTSEFEGKGNMEQRCPHCKAGYKAILKTITLVEITLTALLLISLLINGVILSRINVKLQITSEQER